MADAIPGSGTAIAVPAIDGAAGPAGGLGPVPAGGPSYAVAAAADPLGRAAPPPAPVEAAGLVPRQAEPVVMLAAGLAFIVGVSLFRSRQRRRRGWGMLPDRGGPQDQLWQ